MVLRPGVLVNAAGHGAVGLAMGVRGRPAREGRGLTAYYCKGNYFKLQGERGSLPFPYAPLPSSHAPPPPSGRPSPFSRLVYPVPEAAGLGIHATIDLAGQTRFGPDTQWVQDPHDLLVDPGRAQSFAQSVRRPPTTRIRPATALCSWADCGMWW